MTQLSPVRIILERPDATDVAETLIPQARAIKALGLLPSPHIVAAPSHTLTHGVTCGQGGPNLAANTPGLGPGVSKVL